MKTNAIIRILIWSIVILVLTGILIGGLTFGSFFIRDYGVETYSTVIPVTEPSPALQYTTGELVVLTENTNLYSSPSMDSPVYGTLDAGVEVEISKRERITDTEWAFIISPEFGWIPVESTSTEAPAFTTTPTTAETQAPAVINVFESPAETSTPKATFESGQNVTVTVQESINGTAWVYITSPETGWVLAADLNLPEETVPAPDLQAEMENKSRFDAGKITSISIKWVAGNIVMEPWDGDCILVSDTGSPDNKYNMMFKTKQNELEILFCQELQIKNFSFGIHEEIRKDLLIQVPRNWTGQELEIETAAANLEVYSQTFQEVEIDGASGVCFFENCAIQELDLDTASGNVEYTGTLRSLDFDAASASFKGVLTNVPKQIDMDSMSGDLDLTLPADAGFSVKIDGMSSDFSSDFPTTTQNGRYICGDERCRIDVDGMSSDVYIRKAS